MARMSLIALDYVNKVLEKAIRALMSARMRSGVTDEEIINLQQKVAVLEWIKALIKTEIKKENER